MWCRGLVALWHVESSWTRAQTRVPCIGRRILNHCATREALIPFYCQITVHCMDIQHFVYPFIHQCTFAFWLLKTASVNTDVQIFMWICFLISLGYTLRSEIVGSYSSFMFNVLSQIVSQSVYTMLQSHQQCMNVLISPHP